MTYAFTQDVPITLDIYHEIKADLGEQPPEGLIVHLAQVMEDGHLRYLDVWESEAASSASPKSGCIQSSAVLSLATKSVLTAASHHGSRCRSHTCGVPSGIDW